jgi:serine protease
MRPVDVAALVGVASLALSLVACQRSPGTRGGDPSPSPIERKPTLSARQREAQKLLERRVRVPFVPGEIIAKRKVAAGRSAATPPPEIRRLGFTEESKVSGGEVVFRLSPSVGATMSRGAASDRTLQAIAMLKNSGQYEYAQPNYLLRIADTTANDTRFPQQWHYLVPSQAPGGIGLPKTWDTNKGNSSVVVAVIDTGLLSSHPDIAGSPNISPGFDMIDDGFRANDGDGRDADPTDPGDGTAPGDCEGDPGSPNSWHGTHVSGTVGVGKTNNGDGIAGINWQVKVQSVRVLGRCGGSLVDIHDGIRWAAGLPVPGVPNNAPPAKIINLSLGGALPCSDSPSTQSAIDDAVTAGTTVVVAAGNEASDASGFLPAGCNNVIAVAASDFRGNLVARYSNFGNVVDVLAPGGDVERDDNNDGNPDGVLSTVEGGYEWYNGTSMAAPHVTGVAALLLAADRTLTPAQVEARIRSSARPRTSAQCPRPCGAGLLTAPLPSPGPPPTP